MRLLSARFGMLLSVPALLLLGLASCVDDSVGLVPDPDGGPGASEDDPGTGDDDQGVYGEGGNRDDGGQGGNGGGHADDGGFLGSTSGTAPSISLLTRMENSALDTAYMGERRVFQSTTHDSAPVTIEFMESVTSDGTGGFQVITEHVSGAHDVNLFEAVQLGRQKFSLTQRDFHVVDARMLVANYAMTLVGGRTIAGHTTVELRAQRQINPTSRHSVFIEPDTGLILAWYESKLTGEPLISFEYETIEFDPDLSGMSFQGSAYSSSPLTILSDGTAPDLGFELFQPTLPPTGHRLIEAQNLLDPLGRSWAKLYYSDGATITVWMHREQGTGDGDDGVSWTNFGGATAVLGEVEGVPIVAVGRVNEGVLLMAVQSAF